MTDARPALDVGPLEVLRFLVELAAFAALAVWGFVACADWFPWNLVIGVLAPATAVTLWALFRSPRAVFRLDAFGKALIEIAVMAAAAFALWDLGWGLAAAIFAVVAMVVGVLAGRKELA